MNTIINFYRMLLLIKMDFNRYTGYWWNPIVLIAKMFKHPGMTFSVLYRVERYLLYESNIVFKLVGYLLYPIYFFITYYILSYHIEPQVKIGGGLYLHNRDIVMTENISIGKYFNCMGQTTIGLNQNAKNPKIKIGDDVTLGVGAKIIAKERLVISSGIVIGANAVVTRSLDKENGIYVGLPARFLKNRI
jgi:serine acetyltransferase